MSIVRRSMQWGTFARVWHLYDAKWQDPYISALHLIKYLTGKYKPIYHPMNDCGDHLVIMNSQHIALRGDEWRKRAYFHHTRRARGATWTLAWELHSKDPTMIMKKAIYSALEGNLQRRHTMERLHIFPEENIPEEILQNISNQIKQLRPIPRRYDDIPKEEIDEFPRLIHYPEQYVKI